MARKFDLDALKNAFANQNKRGGGNNFSNDDYYPFWKMEAGTSSDTHNIAVVRFLPDANMDNNLGFLQEHKYHKLIINGKTKRVPCLEMYGKECPVCQHSRKLYDEGNETEGKKYFRTQEFIANAIIRSSPFEFPGVGQAKLLSLGSKIFKNIQGLFASGELDTEPFDYENGYDFRLIKTMSGQWANYDTSNFARKSSALTAAELEVAVAGEVDLSTKRMPEMSVEEITAFLMAAINGESAPAPREQAPADDHEPAPARTPAPAASTPVQSVADSAGSAPKPKRSAAEILAEIKAKQQANA